VRPLRRCRLSAARGWLGGDHGAVSGVGVPGVRAGNWNGARRPGSDARRCVAKAPLDASRAAGPDTSVTCAPKLVDVAKKRRYTLYLDEHVDPVAKELLTGVGFRCIRISESKYRGQDEHDYIDKLRSESAVFVTGDREFLEHVDERGMPHAGIIEIPVSLPRDTKQLLAALVAGWLKGADLRRMSNVVLYWANDGLRLRCGGKDKVVYSIPQINRDLEEFRSG
jgi:Domain of unknown function (DUF5615)